MGCSPTDDPTRECAPASRVALHSEGVAEHRFAAAGVLVADLDGDSRPDILAPGPDQTRLWWNRAEGFVAATGLPEGRDGAGASAADYDGDGDLDVYITRYGRRDQLLRNEGGVLVDGTDAADLPDEALHGQASAWADFDGDGDLDLVVLNRAEPEVEGDQVVVAEPADPGRLFLNRGDGTFEDASHALPEEIHDGYGFAVVVTDLNGDGRPDLYTAHDYPVYQRGVGAVWTGSAFETLDGSWGLDRNVAGMGLAAADLNGDGLDEFLVPAWDKVVFLASTDLGPWVDASLAAGFTLPSHDATWVGWGAEWGDLDNDGDLDAVVAFGHLDPLAAVTPSGVEAANPVAQPDVVFENLGTSGFAPVEQIGGGVSRGFVLADLDGDGSLDRVARDLSGPVTVDLAGCPTGSWLSVALADDGANPHAVGASIRVGDQTRTIRAGGLSLASGGPPVAHFGLGDSDRVTVEVTWPDGVVTREEVETRRAVELSR